MAIGVLGCLPEMPASFPLGMAENAGNMIHANAPFAMLPDCYYAGGTEYRASGRETFTDFVNYECSHLVLTLDNLLRVDADDGTPFKDLHDALIPIEKPIVVFGLGIQSDDADVSQKTLPKEAIELMQFLSSRAPAVGVRGHTTAKILREICGVQNTFVTGCPSAFSQPRGLATVRRNLKPLTGRASFCATKYHVPVERDLLHRAIREKAFLVEPVNRHNHQFHVDVSKGLDGAAVPYFCRDFLPSSPYMDARTELRRYYLSMYRLFRHLETWYEFNRESVGYTYGTRFHVNMASLLAGKPALWVTHDERTRELADFLHLPSISLDQCQGLGPQDIPALLDYEDFLEHIPGLFDNFNEYLVINGLPPTERVIL